VARIAGILIAVGLLAAGTPAVAQTYRLVAPDGTVHFTNTPTDPRYRRQGLFTGAGAPPPRAPIVTASISAPFATEIVAAAERYGIPESLIRAVIRVESAFNARAVSRKGARGLMQLMPETAMLLGVRDPFNPRENIDGGVRHLRALMERFNDLPLALAAYNAGEQAVLAYGGIPPYQETRDYVTRVLQQFGIQAPAQLPTTTYRVVERDGAVVYTNIPPRGKLY
jgi:soluble lytic murein transglycosylase-like protein